jgi:hypothetical protein
MTKINFLVAHIKFSISPIPDACPQLRPKININSYPSLTNYRYNTGYFTSDNEPGGIENATHNTFPK